MEPSKESKRKKDRTDDDDEEKGKERKSMRVRSRSGSPKSRKRDSTRKRRYSRSQTPDPTRPEKKKEGPKEVKPEPPARKPKETDMLNTRTGGAYIPPARLRMMQAQITDKSSIAYQRLAWEALKKSIHGHINKVNVGNIGIIIRELLKENIVRGRGLLCRSIIQAQAASPTFTNVYAALVAAINSRLPSVGELLLKRLVVQFKRGYKRNDKSICISAASFIAHLVNQRVVHEIIALELLTLLIETPSDDSVEVAIAFMKESGQKLTEVSSKAVNAIFDMMRNILHEGQLDKRVQYMIEVLFQIWKDGFKDHPAVLEELDLVSEEEQFTHLVTLDDTVNPQDILNVFKYDENYEETENKYKALCFDILGSDGESEEATGEHGSEESEDDDEEEGTEQQEMTIIDNTETNLVALRRTIYLTINSSLDFEECAHKLLKMQLKPGQEVELCHMFLDCCAEQRTYEKFYGLLAQRFCNLNRIYIGPFEEIFKDSYGTAHRLDTNRLRNVSKFFAHLLFTDSISWEVLECVRLNEEDTTSSSRIYIKILFQELAEYMGLKKLNDRLKDPTLQGAFLGVFPRDNPKNTRFSINFFTTIGLGGLTDELREHLKQIPKNVLPPPEINLESGSSSDSSSSSSSSDSSSDSNEDSSKKKKKNKKKSKKDKKNKSPKTPEEPDKSKDTERWGHDGFYDNYGADARRHEQAHERDKDNFVIPEMPKRSDRRNQNEDRTRRQREDGNRDNDRNREDREGLESRRSDKYGERRDKERNSRDERPDRDRNSKDERSDKERNYRDETSGRDRDSRDERSDKERNYRDETSGRDRDSKDERSDKERNSRDETSDRDRDSRDERSDKERNYRDETSGRDRDSRDERSDKENKSRGERAVREKRSRDEKSDRGRSSRDERPHKENNREQNSRDERPDRERDERPDRERDERSDRERDERPDRERDERSDRERDGRSGKDNERKARDNVKRHRGDRRDKKKRSDRDDERRDKENSNRDDEPKSKDRSKSNKKSSKRERNSDREKDDYVREKIDSDDKRRDRNDREERDTRRERGEIISSGVDKDGILWHFNGEYKTQKKIEKTKKNDANEKEDSDAESSGSDSSSSSSSSSSSDDSTSKVDDGWDIRGSSVRREIVGRYWDIPDSKQYERSPVRESRRDR